MTSNISSTINLRVRYQETDQMGVAHHSAYLIWYEAARTEWLRLRGLSYRECEARGWFLPVVECGACYHLPTRYDDLIAIETKLSKAAGADFRFDYTVRNPQSQQILATGFTRHVCINREQRIDRQATKYLRELFNG